MAVLCFMAFTFLSLLKHFFKHQIIDYSSFLHIFKLSLSTGILTSAFKLSQVSLTMSKINEETPKSHLPLTPDLSYSPSTNELKVGLYFHFLLFHSVLSLLQSSFALFKELTLRSPQSSPSSYCSLLAEVQKQTPEFLTPIPASFPSYAM